MVLPFIDVAEVKNNTSTTCLLIVGVKSSKDHGKKAKECALLDLKKTFKPTTSITESLSQTLSTGNSAHRVSFQVSYLWFQVEVEWPRPPFLHDMYDPYVSIRFVYCVYIYI